MMTRVQLNRLKKLHDYVKKEVKPKHFHMMDFRLEPDAEGGDFLHRTLGICTLKDKSCGSVGCLMGHAAMIYRRKLINEGIIGRYDTDWDAASKSLFGTPREGDPRWDYLFSGDWSLTTQGYSAMVPQKDQKRAALTRLNNMIKSKGIFTDEMKKEMQLQGISHYSFSYGEPDENQQC